jgi:hypothetical protein
LWACSELNYPDKLLLWLCSQMGMILLWLFSILMSCGIPVNDFTCKMNDRISECNITLRYILTLWKYNYVIDVQCEEYGIWHYLYILNMILCNGNDQIKLFLQRALHSNTSFVFFLFMLEDQPQDKQILLDLWGHLNYVGSLQKKLSLPQPVLQKKLQLWQCRGGATSKMC